MKILVFFLITLFTNPSEIEFKENPTFELHGTVVEYDTGEPLTGALVKIEGMEKEYYTDFEGRFSIAALVPGSYSLEVSFTSFKSAELKEIQLNQKNNDLFIGLR